MDEKIDEWMNERIDEWMVRWVKLDLNSKNLVI